MQYLAFLAVIFSFIVVQSPATEKTKDGNTGCKYSHISTHLEAFSDDEILTLLKQGTPLNSGWGTTIKIEIDGMPIFVKQVPLNEIEGKAQNIGSTENLFGLPVYYQYGVGSSGFSVWREVSAHIMSTNWVLAGESSHFPLMYHWRILPNFQEKKPFNEEKFQKYLSYWENSKAIGERIKANHNTSDNIVLFIEYLPITLQEWLSGQWDNGPEAFDKAVEMTERNLLETTAFINSKGMLHFDAHFHNILTDGETIYFSDFGLATSSQFELSNDERQFFQDHRNYDRCYVVMALTNWIICATFGEERLDEVLQSYAKGETPGGERLTPYLSKILDRYASLTLKMNVFFKTLRNETKQVKYPAEELESLWLQAIKKA